MIETDRDPNTPLKRPWKQRLVRKFILANPSATLKEVERACRTSLRTASRVRKDLIDEGKLAPAAVGRPPSVPAPRPDTSNPDQAEEQIRKDIEEAVANGRVLTREERQVRLSAIASHPLVPHASKIAAMKELEALEPPQTSELGPGAPLTRADRVQRAALILEALEDIDGKDATDEAVATARRNLYDGPERHPHPALDPAPVAPPGPDPPPAGPEVGPGPG